MMGTKVYKYGALCVADECVLQQMRLARRYYNQLVEAENLRRRLIWGADSPPAPPHDDCRCEDCASHWRSLRDRYYAESFMDLKPLRAAIRAEGLHWGTYLVIEQAFAAAVKKTDPLKPVRFRSWRQGDVIAVQIQRSESRSRWENQFRIWLRDDPRRGRRAGHRRNVQIRIGSDRKRRPIWSEPIRIVMHRELKGRVTWVHLRRKWIGDREIWSVAFTCADVPERTDLAEDGVIAVDIGWRKMPDGSLRLAFAQDLGGNTFELAMPATWCELGARADRIRSHRDERLNVLKAADPRFAKVRSCPGVARKAREAEIDDPAIGDWLKRDRHLQRYELGCRRRSQAARKARLAEWARMLRRRYATLVLKDTKHRELKEAKDLPPPARRRGHHGAPGETREYLESVFGRKTNVALVDASWTTGVCSICGAEMEVTPELTLNCERCGAEHDRDRVSTRNMLALHHVGEAKRPAARKATARFAKRHRNSETSDNACSVA